MVYSIKLDTRFYQTLFFACTCVLLWQNTNISLSSLLSDKHQYTVQDYQKHLQTDKELNTITSKIQIVDLFISGNKEEKLEINKTIAEEILQKNNEVGLGFFFNIGYLIMFFSFGAGMELNKNGYNLIIYI